VSLSNSTPNGVITKGIVKDSMFNDEARRKEEDIFSHSKALVIERQGRSKSKKPHRYDSHDKLRGKS
jgi:hypothetical protein